MPTIKISDEEVVKINLEIRNILKTTDNYQKTQELREYLKKQPINEIIELLIGISIRDYNFDEIPKFKRNSNNQYILIER